MLAFGEMLFVLTSVGGLLYELCVAYKFEKSSYCLALFCPKFTAIENGNYTCTRYFRLGSVCRFACNDGYIIDPLDHPGLLCYKTSNWVGPPFPVCRKVCKFRKLNCPKRNTLISCNIFIIVYICLFICEVVMFTAL